MRILILGATGMFGHAAYRVLSRKHDVLATCRGEHSASPLRAIVPRRRCFEQLAAGDEAGLEAVLVRAHPEVVVNAIGLVRQRPEASDATAQRRVNAEFPHAVAALAERANARLIHLSTDCVFSGDAGMYRPSDAPDPVDVYGRSKLLGEVTHRPHLTIRTSIVGRQLGGSHGLVEWLIANRGGTVSGFTRAVFSGLTSEALASVIAQVLDCSPGLTGLYHVASAPISKHDLLARLNAKLELGIEIVPDGALRCDRSLDGRAFQTATGIEVPGHEAMLDRLAEDSPRYDAWRATACAT